MENSIRLVATAMAAHGGNREYSSLLMAPDLTNKVFRIIQRCPSRRHQLWAKLAVIEGFSLNFIP